MKHTVDTFPMFPNVREFTDCDATLKYFIIMGNSDIIHESYKVIIQQFTNTSETNVVNLHLVANLTLL